jgi:uncharacterized membrane protein YcaP (DUF421 family)
LIDAVRQQGVFDISEVANAVVETNGTLSVQTKSDISPLTPKDAGIDVDEAEVPITIVMDGKPVTKYFANSSFDNSEIELITTSTGIATQDILLLNITDSGQIYIIRKDKE